MQQSCKFAMVGLSCALMAACSLDEVEEAPPAGLERISAFEATMTRTSSPYTSNLAPNPQIELWITKESKALYDKISPTAQGSKVRLPQGALIVRAVYEGAQVKKLTVMGKGAPGSNPIVGDWWFAVTTPRGVPLEEGGQQLAGKLPQCVTCHDERGADDYLFGVTAAAHI